MPRYDDPGEPFYFGEVIGSAMSYHLPTCHIIPQIRRRNRKRLRDWQEASRLGLKPCPHCHPPEAASRYSERLPLVNVGFGVNRVVGSCP